MAVLTPEQRNALESAVKQARKNSEIGAFNALKAMAVNNPEPFTHMTAEQRSLRNNLRSKARLLGDELPANGAQRIDNLSYELAYETWHKMLFAKFLEANDLLIHTASGVAVSMEDCEELAKDEEFLDKWDAAANYASKMLPAIFRTDDPLMQITYATDERIKLESIIDALEGEIFTADDALGWVYQFWQSEAKAIINASGDKIDGAKLPAVTQLFTEPYMVHFLIDNTLGAWWVSRNPGVRPPVKFEYLRLLENSSPAAGQFEGWPDKTAGVTSLDPCMGSGHFVASLFPVFAALRMHEEGLSKEDATDKVIKENLHGLELDPRCTQISAFNLALTAWKFCGHYKELPEMNLACSGIAPKGKVEDWIKLVGKVNPDEKGRMENGMRMLYEHFQLAPELGSLLDPKTIKADVFTASFDDLQPVLNKALENEVDNEQIERGVMAAGIAKAGELLNFKYTIVITNVPYLGANKMSKYLNQYCETKYPASKSDLATVFIERAYRLVVTKGNIATVSPQGWINLDYYKNFRKELFNNKSLNFLVGLGSGAFATITGEVVKALLSSVQNDGKAFSYMAIDANDDTTIDLKINRIKSANSVILEFKKQSKNPDSRIMFIETSNSPLLSRYAETFQGLATGDSFEFNRKHFEIEAPDDNWIFAVDASDKTNIWSGRTEIVFWQKGLGRMSKISQNPFRGKLAWNRKGLIISSSGKFSTTLYNGEIFLNSGVAIIPESLSNLNAIWNFVTSPDFSPLVRAIDRKLMVTTATLVKIPFDLKRYQNHKLDVEAELSKPFSNDPIQWLFHGHPIQTDKPLQVALARLLGYRWPAESNAVMELADEAKTLIEAVKAFDHLSDDDGIFCIPSVNAEQAGADRIRTFLQAVFAGEWNNNTISDLLEKEGSSASNLEDWLRKEFFIQHCKVFQNRPFIWHIWDGRNDGFSALVNYHKLDKENLSKLIYTYLGDWIRMCEAKKKNEESGAEGLLSAAIKLKEKLEAILLGEVPYDIFVRWKSLLQQPIGWEPDLSDGVRLNIRPFVEAGVLRNKFNVKWGVDRGKNPPGSFWGEIRDNDKHLTIAEKRAARENNLNNNGT